MNRKNDRKVPPLRHGWIRVPDEKVPKPTFWPAALALGAVLTLWGFVTSFIVATVGLVLLAVSITRWLGEMRHD